MFLKPPGASGTARPPLPERLRPTPPLEPGRSVRLWADPRYQPPPQGERFMPQTFQSLTGVTSASFTAFQVSRGSRGVIREITWQINDTLASTVVFFTLRLNGGAVPGYRFQVFPRVATHVTVSFDVDTTFVDLKPNDKVDVLVEVNDAGTYLLGSTLGGWTYPSELLTLATLRGEPLGEYR